MKRLSRLFAEALLAPLRVDGAGKRDRVVVIKERRWKGASTGWNLVQIVASENGARRSQEVGFLVLFLSIPTGAGQMERKQKTLEDEVPGRTRTDEPRERSLTEEKRDET
jgi:predicted amidophosphoribosyltransferase